MMSGSQKINFKEYGLHIPIKIIAGISIFFFAGCSINNCGIEGFLDQQVRISPSAKIVRTRARGIYFYTEPAFGIQIGYIERDLIFPILTDESGHCLNLLLSLRLPGPAQAKADYSERPFMIETERIGIGMEISPYSFTGNLGVHTSRAIRIKANSSFTLYSFNSKENEYKEICMAINQSGGRDE